jgi:hypothetical protein
MELSSDERRAFVAHLKACPACREAVDEQRWIDELLRSDEAAKLEAAPNRSTIGIRFRSRRRWLVAAAAAAVFVAATFAVATRKPKTVTREPALASVPSPAPAAPELETPLPGADRAPAAAFVSAGSSIAIPVVSDDPQITVVQLYPTVTAQRRWARETALRSEAISPHGG